MSKPTDRTDASIGETGIIKESTVNLSPSPSSRSADGPWQPGLSNDSRVSPISHEDPENRPTPPEPPQSFESPSAVPWKQMIAVGVLCAIVAFFGAVWWNSDNNHVALEIVGGKVAKAQEFKVSAEAFAARASNSADAALKILEEISNKAKQAVQDEVDRTVKSMLAKNERTQAAKMDALKRDLKKDVAMMMRSEQAGADVASFDEARIRAIIREEIAASSVMPSRVAQKQQDVSGSGANTKPSAVPDLPVNPKEATLREDLARCRTQQTAPGSSCDVLEWQARQLGVK